MVAGGSFGWIGLEESRTAGLWKSEVGATIQRAQPPLTAVPHHGGNVEILRNQCSAGSHHSRRFAKRCLVVLLQEKTSNDNSQKSHEIPRNPTNSSPIS